MKNKAFSLVELMIVIAIVGILSAIAIPSYKKYIIKSKIASGLSILKGVKTKILDHHAATGTFLPNSDVALSGNFVRYETRTPEVGGVPGPGSFLGRISIVYNFAIEGNSNPALQIAMHENNGIISWTCFAWPDGNCWGYGIPANYLPAGCINTSGCDR